MQFSPNSSCLLAKSKVHKPTTKLVSQQTEGAHSIDFLGPTNCLYHNVKKTFFKFWKSKVHFLPNSSCLSAKRQAPETNY